jgi:hypothetical protein
MDTKVRFPGRPVRTSTWMTPVNTVMRRKTSTGGTCREVNRQLMCVRNQPIVRGGAEPVADGETKTLGFLPLERAGTNLAGSTAGAAITADAGPGEPLDSVTM